MSAIRRTLPLVLLAALAGAPELSAAPTVQTPVIVVELEHTTLGHHIFFSKLTQATVEPGGIEVNASSPPEWLTIGFKPGDLVITENGSPIGERLMFSDGIHLFDVIRNKKAMILKVIVHPAPRRSKTVDESNFDKLVDVVSTPNDVRSTPVNNAAGPSGVRVIDTILSLYLECEVGDIVRSIDGLAIHSDAELSAAVKGLKVGPSDIALERLGRPITLTLIRKAPLDLTGVKRLSATKFEITRAFADAVAADRDVLVRKIETSPYVKNGKAHGFNVYNINKDSPAAALGILDGDIVVDFDGHSIDNFSDVIDTAQELVGVVSLTVHVERKGKPLMLTYTVR